MIEMTDARAALRARLGPGARYDDARAPGVELRWARLGTAYFARKLNELTDRQLSAEEEQGLRFRQIVCGVAYQARSFAKIIEWVRNGELRPDQDPFKALSENVQLGVTLPGAAIRHLFKHSEVHLNVEWRDLRGSEWDAVVYLPGRKSVAVRETAWKRARSIWLNAVDLGNGGTFADFPVDLVDALLIEASSRWKGSESFVVHPSDRNTPIVFGSPDSTRIIRGKAVDLARWVTGRVTYNINAEPLPAIAADCSLSSQ